MWEIFPHVTPPSKGGGWGSWLVGWGRITVFALNRGAIVSLSNGVFVMSLSVAGKHELYSFQIFSVMH